MIQKRSGRQLLKNALSISSAFELYAYLHKNSVQKFHSINESRRIKIEFMPCTILKIDKFLIK